MDKIAWRNQSMESIFLQLAHAMFSASGKHLPKPRKTSREQAVGSFSSREQAVAWIRFVGGSYRRGMTILELCLTGIDAIRDLSVEPLFWSCRTKLNKLMTQGIWIFVTCIPIPCVTLKVTVQFRVQYRTLTPNKLQKSAFLSLGYLFLKDFRLFNHKRTIIVFA